MVYGWCFVSVAENVPEIIARQMLVLRVGDKGGVLRGCVSWIIVSYVSWEVLLAYCCRWSDKINRCEWNRTEASGGWGLFEWATIAEAVEFARLTF